MPKTRTTRIYTRTRGGATRFYIDLRDLGGGREALKVNGEKRGTTDPDIAAELGARRVKQLGVEKRRKVVDGVERVEGLKRFASEHLTQKARGGKVTAQWLEAARYHLLAASDFFGDDRRHTEIR